MKKCLFFVFLFFVSLSSIFAQEYFPYKDEWKGTYGYMDINGNIVIPAQFSYVSEFIEGVAIVKKDRKEYYLKSDGKIVEKIDMPSNWYGETKGLTPFKDGLAIINKSYFIDKNFKVVSKQYDYVNKFSEGFALVMRLNEYFFIDKSFKEVSPYYDNASSFSEGIAIVRIDDRVVAVDTQFKELFDIPGTAGADYYFRGEDDGGAVIFKSGLFPVENANYKWGYINNKGEVVIKPQFVRWGYFYGNYAVVNDVSVINKSVEEVWYISAINKSQYKYHNNYLIYPDFMIGWEQLVIVDIPKKSKKKVTIGTPFSFYILGNNIYVFGYNGSVNIISFDGNIIATLYKILIWYGKYLVNIGDNVTIYDINGKKLISK